MRNVKVGRPSPSLVISVMALIVALGGTATAGMKVLITSSKQVKAGAIRGSDVKDRSLTSKDLAAGTVSASSLSSSVRSALDGQGATAEEAVRKAGPESQPAGKAVVATLSNLQVGTYAIFAKTILTTPNTNGGLLQAVVPTQKQIAGHCVLSVGADQDDARAPIATPYTQAPETFNLQMTRSIASPSDAVLTCDADGDWRASDTSIIAIKLDRSTRTDVSG